MLSSSKKIALISDFDGTISKTDFFYYVIDNFLEKDDLKPWNDYLERKITHVDALDKIFRKIRIEKDKFHEFILTLPIEDCFINTVNYCKENDIDFYIVSAGADYYIKLILEKLNVKDKVNIFSNDSIYSNEKGLQLLKRKENDKFYSYDYGISKKLVAQSIKEKYDVTVFAGDGGPDIEPAKLADYVFARGRLLELCNEQNVKTKQFSSYCDILEFLKDGINEQDV